MSGYQCFMRSVRLKANFFFLVLILLIASNGYSDTCKNIYTRTDLEAGGSSIGKGLENFFTGKWDDLNFDPHLLKEIKVTAIKDQGIDGYFNPKIQVCDYEGNNCYQLYSETSCRQIYGTQTSGAGISAAVFIDWEGDKMLGDGKIKEGIAKGLEWEWVDSVTDEEKRKFANSPKICACSQKAACISGIFEWADKVGEGANIFRPGGMENVCDTCYQKKVKCAPIPLAPSPPPFCEQLAMSLPQVRIVPITDEDNDYFNPKVKVIAGDLIEEDGKIGKALDFPRKYKKDKAEERPTSDKVRKHSILDKDGTTHYFKTYRKKDQLCAEYHGTEKSNKKLQFPPRCFPAPPAPEPEVVKIVDQNTLKIEMKMNSDICGKVPGNYSNGSCAFNVNTDSNYPTKIGPLSLKVVKPAIVAKTTNSSDSKGDIDNIIESILKNNSQFEILKEYGYVPDIETECKELKEGKCKLDNLGYPKIEVKYSENSKSKMFCLSGWQPEPEEFVLKRGNEIIPLKLMGTKYIKYNAVYSKESNQFYYLPSKERETVDPFKRRQDQLDKIIFNKQGYVFFPDESKQEKGKCSYCVKEDSKIDEKLKSGEGLKVVYKLIDGKQYLDKKDNSPFYLEYEEVDCKDKDGKTLKDENGEVQKCTQLKDQLIKANRTEVFYADKLCKFDLEGLKKKLKEIIKEQLKNKKQELEKNNEKSHDHENKDVYIDDLSIMFDRIEIEAWGSGEAGHIKDTPDGCTSPVCSTESRAGIPGDYIKAKLKIDPNYPIIKVKVTEGGGNQENRDSDKDGGPIFIEMCNSQKQHCKPLITVAGGGKYRTYGPENTSYKDTIIYEQDLKLEEKIIKADKLKSTQDNQITYIENGKIKYETIDCESGFRSSKPGAGGCIDKSEKIYGKGSPGYVKIRPIIKEFNVEEINDAIEKVIGDQYDLGIMTDFSIGDLNVDISKIIEEEVKKELLGQ